MTSKRNTPATVQKACDEADTRGAEGTVRLHGEPVSLQSEVGAAFIADCARNVEGVISDAEVQAKHGFCEKDWAALVSNSALLAAVRSERERRLLSGEAAREAAQRHFANAPGVLNRIMTDEQAPPRHRIEAARELRQAAAGGPEIAPAPKEKFTITINLGSATEVYEKFIDPRGPLLVDDGEAS